MFKIFRNNYSTFDTVADAVASGMKVGQKFKIYGYHTRGDGYQRKGVVVELSGQTIDNGKYHLMANGHVLDIYIPAHSTFSTIIWGVDTTQSDNGTRLNAMAEYLHSRSDIAAGYDVKFPSQTINVEKEVIWRTRNDQIVNFNGNGVKLAAPSQNINVFSLNGDLLPENWWKYHPTEANVGADLLADLQAADADPETRIDAIYTLLNNRGTDPGDRAYTEPNAFTDAQFPMGHPHFKNMKFQGGRNGLTVVSSYGGSTSGCKYISNRDSGERLIFGLMFKSEKNLATNNTNESFVARNGNDSYRFRDLLDTTTITEPRTFNGFSQCNSTEYNNCRVYNMNNAKSAFSDYGNSNLYYFQCISEGGTPLIHFSSIGTNTTAYGVTYDSIHVESQSTLSFLISSKIVAEIRSLYQQLNGDVLANNTSLEYHKIYNIGKLSNLLSPNELVDYFENDSNNITTPELNQTVFIDGVGINDFTSHDYEIATYNGNSWDFRSPEFAYEGIFNTKSVALKTGINLVATGDRVWYYDGSSWSYSYYKFPCKINNIIEDTPYSLFKNSIMPIDFLVFSVGNGQSKKLFSDFINKTYKQERWNASDNSGVFAISGSGVRSYKNHSFSKNVTLDGDGIFELGYNLSMILIRQHSSKALLYTKGGGILGSRDAQATPVDAADVGATYSQAEVQAILDELHEVKSKLVALGLLN